jgi:hypothetical protein
MIDIALANGLYKLSYEPIPGMLHEINTSRELIR